jgi:NADH dehydrogenase FAD-containing subunit
MDPVLVAGCGNAGLAAAMELASRIDTSVIVVDPEGTMWYRSRYHRAVEAGSLDPVTLEVGPVLSQRGVSFRQDRLVDVDPDGGVATFATGDLRFAKLVVAVGAATRPAPGTGRRILSFRDDLPELLDALESSEVDRIVVAGGGTSGLHAAAALAGDAGVDDVLLAHAGDRILPTVTERAARKAADRLEDLGVTILTGTRVERAAGRKVHLSEGTVETDRLLWCGGIQRREMLDETTLPTNERGLAVDAHLRCGSEDVYAVGDATWFDGKIPDAYYGFHEARAAARNIARDLKGKDPKQFRVRYHPRSLYLGGGNAGLVVRGRLWTGRTPNWVRHHIVEDGYDHMLRWIW